MEILYGTQQLLGMKKEENEFMTPSSTSHGDVNWYTFLFFIKNNRKELFLPFLILSVGIL